MSRANDSPLNFSCPTPAPPSTRVLLSHGGGGRMSRRLIQQVFHKHFQSAELARDHDGAYLDLGDRKLAFSTDGFVVRPAFFPGGDIGSLAVHGTVNDLAACGAQARWMSAAFILEEGFPLADLERIVASMAAAARQANVELVTGDTKVVEHGKGDGIYITTSGVGVVFADPVPEPRAVMPDDLVVISGPIGLHGMAVMSVREGLAFDSELKSDSAPLGDMVAAVYRAGARPRCLRDPTRGGLAATLAEIAQVSQTSIVLEEDALPVPEMVKGACEILGLDPLLVANEGLMLFVVSPDDEAAALQALQAHPRGRQAVTIGRVQAEEPGNLLVHTPLGSTFILDIPAGEELPRIC
jgi:hydrogenase expression/formation protein HypE